MRSTRLVNRRQVTLNPGARRASEGMLGAQKKIKRRERSTLGVFSEQRHKGGWRWRADESCGRAHCCRGG